MRRTGFVFLLLSILLPLAGLAAPYGEKGKAISFTQPDSSVIDLRIFGDEFYATTETLDGYTVVFDHAAKAYVYASLSTDESTLLATDERAGKGTPQTLTVPRHLRINLAERKAQARERFLRWDAGMGVSAQWDSIKSIRRAMEAAAKDGIAMAPPSFTTVGTKAGLTLLIDFDDDPATVAQTNIQAFCNATNYSGYGNNGSVRQYFLDNSNGQLDYTNVVTVYIRIPNSLHPKSWYNDTSKDCGDQANLLIRDAITIMTNLPNYTTEILPALNNLTVDGANQVIACNVFYAGGNGGVWSYGLWPHSWSLYNVGAQYLSPGGKKIFKYQVTNIGNSLELGTFCHENGHMLCGYPDIYDYGYDSIGGAGMFCLMNSGGHGANPVQICAYLKRASGWATTVDLSASSLLTATVSSSGANFNRFYRYAKPGVATEYYLVENRQVAGRDANLPAGGVAIWHIDELGNKDDQRMATNSLHQNYEVTLVQADNLWHFQNNANSGDSKDLYYSGNSAAGYVNRFSDSTAPNARWWNGAASGINFKDFSAKSSNMTFTVEPASSIAVTPMTDAAFTGPVGGSFSPASVVYALTNSRAFSVSWGCAHTQSWVSTTSSGGTIPAYGATNVSVTINTNADALPAGAFADTLIFTNNSDTNAETRAVTLRVGQPDYFTELFDTAANDTDNQSFTFTPNGSADYYSVSRVVTTNFPTDPTGGTTLATGDDGSLLCTLTGGRQISLYGTAYSSFYVSGNGYITFGTSDGEYTESLSSHFSKPRVAGLFDDLNSAGGGSVSWRQLADRAVVTYQNVPEYSTSNTNNFQIELFTNGTLRITCLNIAATDGLIGLSRGTGLPADFLESDFSEYPYSDTQPPTLTINQAASQADPANSSPINFTVVFSESVADFATGDVTITGTAPGTMIGTVTGSGTNYNVAVSGMTDSGTVIAMIATNKAHDAAGNGNTVSTSTDNTVTYDVTAPGCAITRAGASPTNATSVQFSVNFSEAVTGFTVGDVDLSGSAPGRSITGFITNTASSFTVTAGSISGTGTVTIAVATGSCTDAAENLNTAGDPASYDIIKGLAQVTLQNLAQFYDGTPRVITAVTEPEGLTVDITYDGSATVPINPGSYAVTGAVNETMYQGQASGTLTVTYDADTDGDGLPDWWEQQYFGGITNANPNATAANGINTVRETYITGLDPTDAQNVFTPANARLQGDDLVFDWLSSSGRVYTIYWTSNLLSGFTPMQSNYTGGVFTDTIHNANDDGFYRIEVQLAP